MPKYAARSVFNDISWVLNIFIVNRESIVSKVGSYFTYHKNQKNCSKYSKHKMIMKISRNPFFSLIILIFRISLEMSLSKTISLNELSNHSNITQNERESMKLLRVLTTHYVPFMYQDESGQFYNGIEYKLLKIIAEKEHLQLSFQSKEHLHSANRDRILLKYVIFSEMPSANVW